MRMTAEEFRSLKKTNKYNAKKCEYNGIQFDSLMEKEYYEILMADDRVFHIDCHVPVTLPGGLRLNIDFIAWYGVVPKAVEVKGKATSDFKRMRKLFDNTHPLAPLEVWTKSNGVWKTI